MSYMNRRKPFTADYTYTVEGNVIAIVDLDQGNRSVTNDMEDILDNARQNLRDLKRLGVRVVDFTGGEPLLHRQLPDLLREAKQLGLTPPSRPTPCCIQNRRSGCGV